MYLNNFIVTYFIVAVHISIKSNHLQVICSYTQNDEFIYTYKIVFYNHTYKHLLYIGFMYSKIVFCTIY